MRPLLLPVVAVSLLTASSSISLAQQILITVNTVSQRMIVEVNGRSQWFWKVSTGASGYSTPAGTYRPFRMETQHFSQEWDNAPMPYSIFFTPEGHAIHGSLHVKSLGKRASHGCVRISPINAAKLYSLVQKVGMSNTTVVVKGSGLDLDFWD